MVRAEQVRDMSKLSLRTWRSLDMLTFVSKTSCRRALLWTPRFKSKCLRWAHSRGPDQWPAGIVFVLFIWIQTTGVFSSTSKGSRHDGGLSSFEELFMMEEQGTKSKPWSMVLEEVVTWYGGRGLGASLLGADPGGDIIWHVLMSDNVDRYNKKWQHLNHTCCCSSRVYCYCIFVDVISYLFLSAARSQVFHVIYCYNSLHGQSKQQWWLLLL